MRSRKTRSRSGWRRGEQLLRLDLCSVLLLLIVALASAVKQCPKCRKDYLDSDNYCAVCVGPDGRPVRLVSDEEQKPRTKPKRERVQGTVSVSGDTLKVESRPTGAAVDVDGVYVGNTPRVLPGWSFGLHVVKISFRNYTDYVETVEVAHPKEITAEVVSRGDSVSVISVPPGAAISLDGRYVGNSPDTIVGVVPGQHVIELSLPEYAVFTTEVEVAPPPVPRYTFLKKNERGYDEVLWLADSATMVRIPAGPFTMGSELGNDNERPTRSVLLTEFLIDKYEVTNRQYRQFCDATGRKYPDDPGLPGFVSYFEDCPDYPVVNISWEDAKAYCDWVGRRLPTEAEWEKAARGGDARKYPWGDDEPDGSRCVFAGVSKRPEKVGSRPAGMSPYGCLDMAGNVFEWCSDWYDVNYYRQAATSNPVGPDSGAHRVLRGGCWGFVAWFTRCANRHWALPVYVDPHVGFRCAATEK